MESFQNKMPLAISLTTFLPWTPNGTPPLPRRWQLEETRISVSSRCSDVYFRDRSFGVSQMLEDCFFKTLNTHRAPLSEFSVQMSLKNVHSFAYKRKNSIYMSITWNRVINKHKLLSKIIKKNRFIYSSTYSSSVSTRRGSTSDASFKCALQS